LSVATEISAAEPARVARHDYAREAALATSRALVV
jgi:hypothetical protein